MSDEAKPTPPETRPPTDAADDKAAVSTMPEEKKAKREPKVKTEPAPPADRVPHIGDTVQYAEGERQFWHAAIVTMSHSATYVNLYVFPDAYTDPYEMGWAPFARSSVGMQSEHPQLGPCWRWPQ